MPSFQPRFGHFFFMVRASIVVGMILLLPILLLLAACTPTEAPAVQSPTLASSWNGKWTGPEGTFLTVTPQGGNDYMIDIQSLDSFNSYPAIAGVNELTFNRDGMQQTLHKATGAQTGMKWLASKSNCLMIEVGEGYCR